MLATVLAVACGRGPVHSEATPSAVEPGPLLVTGGSTPVGSSGTEEVGAGPVALLEPEAARVPWPPTKLALTVLATLDDPAGEGDRATIRDADSGVIASYRNGDAVRDGVVVLSIEEGVVELSNAGEVEYMTISPVPFEVDPEDVFYPDLIDDLGTEMSDGVQMPKGVAYVLKAPGNAWGTPRTVGVLREAIRTYARSQNGPKVRVGDISRPGGGPFPPHLSHRQGRDVDIGYILSGARKNDKYFHAATAVNLDRDRTWGLVEALLATEEVAYIFMDYELQKLLYVHAEVQGVSSDRLGRLFQYPNGRRASRGKVRHWKGHRGHFHVRFRR